VLKNLFLLFFSTVISFILLDQLLLYAGFPTYSPLIQIYEPSNELGWKLKKNYDGIVTTSEGTWHVSIRDSRRSLPGQARSSGPQKVYAVGDSFAFAQAVDDNDVWLNILARDISGRFNVVFENFGVPGYTPYHYNYVIDKLLPSDLKNDIVVYVFFAGNDFVSFTFDDIRKNQSEMIRNEHEPAHYPAVKRIARSICSRSPITWAAASYILNRYRDSADVPFFFRTPDQYLRSKRETATWGKTIELVTEGIQKVKSRGGRPLLVLLPYGRYYLDRSGPSVAKAISLDFIQDILKKDRELEIIDMTPDVTLDNDILIAKWGHLNKKGNMILAEKVKSSITPFLK